MIIYRRFRAWLRGTLWGNDLGRARRHLIISILAIGLLGGTAKWAQPKFTDWLYPPPPIPPATCTQISMFLSGAVSGIDLERAKKWVDTKETILLSARVWNPQRQRNEFWMTDGKTMWMIELICFDSSSSRYMVYGEFEKNEFSEVLAQQQEYSEAEK